jgi:hypothetical protein
LWTINNVGRKSKQLARGWRFGSCCRKQSCSQSQPSTPSIRLKKWDYSSISLIKLTSEKERRSSLRAHTNKTCNSVRPQTKPESQTNLQRAHVYAWIYRCCHSRSIPRASHLSFSWSRRVLRWILSCELCGFCHHWNHMLKSDQNRYLTFQIHPICTNKCIYWALLPSKGNHICVLHPTPDNHCTNRCGLRSSELLNWWRLSVACMGTTCSASDISGINYFVPGDMLHGNKSAFGPVDKIR